MPLRFLFRTLVCVSFSRVLTGATTVSCLLPPYLSLLSPDSPYYAPLTPLARPIAIAALEACSFLHLGFYLLVHFCARSVDICYIYCRYHLCHTRGHRRTRDLKFDRPNWLYEVLVTTQLTPEEAALKAPSSIDTRAFMWTLDSLDEDDELERFFSSLSDFLHSKVVRDPLHVLPEEDLQKISQVASRFLDFTFSSDLLPEAVKYQRAIKCGKALALASLSDHIRAPIFYHRTQQTTKFGPFTDNKPTVRTAFVQGLATGIVAGPRQRDDSWFRQVAPNALGVSETVLRYYAANGYSLSLAVFNYVIRQQFTYFRFMCWPRSEIRDILEQEPWFIPQATSPELQHEFCTLRNQIVLKAQNDDDQSGERLRLRREGNSV